MTLLGMRVLMCEIWRRGGMYRVVGCFRGSGNSRWVLSAIIPQGGMELTQANPLAPTTAYIQNPAEADRLQSGHFSFVLVYPRRRIVVKM